MRFLERILALLLVVITIPVWVVLFVLIKIDSTGPFIFSQLRTGKKMRSFKIYKIRTMHLGAEKDQEMYRKLNEADGPVFKIRNDPRFTKIGKWLARTGLDELPQLINVMKGEMAFVGPRPLPIEEAGKIPKKYQRRFEVLPGITSLWVVNGSHKLTFKRWMELDNIYIKTKSLTRDIKIVAQTIMTVLRGLTYKR
jgi:lipopolysaccharide/colanic/teichoic acid biosynthesis glycosyltransferase